MRIDSLFPTTWRDTNFPLFQFEATDRISALGDGFQNYWLGYMKYDKIPSAFFTSEFMTGTNGISARVNNSQVNSPVGYTCDDYSYQSYQYGQIKETGFTPSYQYNRYLNSFAVRTHGTKINFSTGSETGTQISIILETGNDENLGTFNRMYLRILSSDDMTTSGLIDFLQGNRDMEFTETINGVSIPFVLKSADLEENGVITYTGNAAGLFYKMSVFISGYGFSPYQSTDSQGNRRYFDILPTIKMYSDYGNYYAFRACGVYSPNSTRVDVNNGQFYLGGNYNFISGIGLLGGWNFDFSLADLAALPTYGFLISGNTMIVSLGRVAELYRIYKPSDIMHHFALMMRIPSSLVFGYTVGVYCPEVLDDGEFTGNLLTGDLTEDDVQPWQWDNINVDEFKEEDVPEYEPEPDEEGENIGDVIHRPASIGVGGTNGFVTQYALRKADILDLGEKLWTSFIDADYWKNYMFSLALDTGTLALSGLLNFFLSCKVYPFPLINIAGCAAWGNAMFVGTGVVPLPFNRTIYALNSTVDYVNGGECTVWSKNFYGDYRDYVNTKITLYVPYCGTVELNPGDVVGNTLKIQYAVDFATGGCIAYVDMTSGDGGGYPVAALTGQIGADIPLTATAAGDVAARFVGDAMKFGGLIGGSVMDTATGMISAGLGAESEKAGGGGSAGDIVKTSLMMQSGLGAGVGFDVAPGVASQLAGMLNRPAVSAPVLAGGRGFASFGAPQVPYIQIRRAIYPTITGLSQINGNPGAGTYKIGDLSGFVQGDIITDGLHAPENEKQKIRKLFANGVYV